jgi:lipopolysaccharide export system protein LptA
VATPELSALRVRRRKLLTGVLISGLLVTTLIVATSFWHRVAVREEHPLRPPPSPAPNVHQQLSGYTFTRSEAGRTIFTLHSARTVAFKEGKTTQLEDVLVEFYGRQGDHHDTLRTHLCQYNPKSGDFFSSGPVQIELNAQAVDLPGTGMHGKHPVFLETSKVSFRSDGSVAETDEPVKFRVGAASGTALGLEYATKDGWIELEHDVAIELQQGSGPVPQPPIQLTASQLHYDKKGASVSLTGPVEITQGGRRATAENARVALNNQNRVTRADLDGNVKASEVSDVRNVEINANHMQGDFDPTSGELRHILAEQNVTGQSKGKGSTSHLAAQRVDLDLAGIHPQPLEGVATGNVHLTLESQPILSTQASSGPPPGPEKKDLTAAEVRFNFRPHNASLQDAATAGPGTLVINSADPKVGGRVITAGQFLMSFDARSRLETLRGLEPTRVLFRPPATAPAGTATQESQADRLDATFDTATQSLREVRQSGNFKFHDGDRQATSAEAHYDPVTQSMLLLGHPQVWDSTSHIKCDRVTMDMRTNTSTGEGNVQAVHLPTPTPGATSSANPALPTNVLADQMTAQQKSQVVHYEGHVRAWQGTDVVESSALDVYRRERRVSSGSRVVTSYLQPALLIANQGEPPTHAAGGTRPVTVRADFLEYLDQGRRARYHGNVQLVTEDTNIQSDLLDVYFTEGDTVEGSEVDHADAEGHVKVTQPGRRGLGDHGQYFAGPGKIVLTGGPPSLFDEEKGFSTGQRLTFFIHDDRLFVDGGSQSPSLSKHRVAP